MISFKELKSEIKRITWPNKKEVLKKTGITLLVCAIMSVIIGIYDLVFSWIIRRLEDIFL
jgi:preprotein translocase subunit SecE